MELAFVSRLKHCLCGGAQPTRSNPRSARYSHAVSAPWEASGCWPRERLGNWLQDPQTSEIWQINTNHVLEYVLLVLQKFDLWCHVVSIKMALSWFPHGHEHGSHGSRGTHWCIVYTFRIATTLVLPLRPCLSRLDRRLFLGSWTSNSWNEDEISNTCNMQKEHIVYYIYSYMCVYIYT